MKHAFGWSPEEDAIVREMWLTHSSHDIAARLGTRTHRAVIGRANRLELKSKKPPPRPKRIMTEKWRHPVEKSFQFMVRARHHESYYELWSREMKERAKAAIKAAKVLRNAPRTCACCGKARQPGYLKCVDHLRAA